MLLDEAIRKRMSNLEGEYVAKNNVVYRYTNENKINLELIRSTMENISGFNQVALVLPINENNYQCDIFNKTSKTWETLCFFHKQRDHDYFSTYTIQNRFVPIEYALFILSKESHYIDSGWKAIAELKRGNVPFVYVTHHGIQYDFENSDAFKQPQKAQVIIKTKYIYLDERILVPCVILISGFSILLAPLIFAKVAQKLFC